MAGEITPSLLFGEGAGDLPGPEVLASFEPMDHLLASAGNSNIAHVPDAPGVLLRWSPFNSDRQAWITRRGYEITEAGLFMAAWHTREQYHIMADNGVQILPHRSFTGSGPAGSEVDDQPVVYTVVVQSTEAPLLSEADPRGIPIVTGLGNYISSPARKRTGRIAHDIYRHTQYRGALVDLEPYVEKAPVHPGRPIPKGYRAKVNGFRVWVTYLHKKHPDANLQNTLDQLDGEVPFNMWS